MLDFYNKIINSFKDNKFFSGIDLDYGRSPCNGDCDDYCRCTYITSTKINSVYVDSILDFSLYDKSNWKNEYKKSDFLLHYYVVDRLFRTCKLYDTSNWSVNVTEGYYGQETDGASLDDNLKDKIITYLTELSSLSDFDKILKILELEYGFVLDKLKNFSNIKIEEVDISNIEIPQKDYGRKVCSEDLTLYESYNLPRAICTKNFNSFSIIDGYHRILAAKKYNINKVKILILE